ncbi:MAG TPA: FAD-dependent monooxygenase [Bauldia sp.]|nr:FAD-dependent monooxygenase [Bauldia sp.]
MPEADAIAIGGGLAGAAFALELARNGRSVLVFERSRSAAQKVCGDFLSAEAIGLLRHLGVDPAKLGASRVTSLRLAAGRSAAEAALPFEAAGLSRLVLDEALLDAAAAAGAELRRGVHVTGLAPDGRGVVVSADGKVHRARHAALATGKHNLRGCQRPAGAVTGFKLQMELTAPARAALEGVVQLVLLPGGYVGACLVDGGRASLCWQIETARLAETGADWRAQLDRFAALSPHFGDVLAGARAVDARAAAVSSLPFGYVRREAIADCVYPVGDQMAVIPAFTGDGTSLALASGILAARALVRGETATAFQRSFAAGLGPQFRVARVVAAIFRREIGRRFTIGALRAAPPLARMVANGTRLTGVLDPILSAPRDRGADAARLSQA